MARKALEPHMWNLESLFKNMYNVPVYQRPYSWDKEQIDTLLNDIFEAYYSSSKYDGYYTGNIIVFDKDEKINGLIVKYDIIDGQQRITSFALILLALYSLALKSGAPDTEKTIQKTKEALWKMLERDFKKDLTTVTLNSIEKKCFSDIYASCFDKPVDILNYCDNYKTVSNFEDRVINNFKNIYHSLENGIKDQTSNGILNFIDYILQYVRFVVIEANCNENKVFSMFESINSKGKKLEEIDIIKTYIFSKLDEKSYNTYLDRWGQLIIKTNDNLYDYLYNYIKAYLRFYRQNINVSNFKDVSKKELLTHFNVTTEREAFEKLLDDMYNKVDYYNMLHSVDDAMKLVNNKRFRFYYKIFTDISYKHPKALFFRTLVEYSENKITKADVVNVVVETVSFMIKFLTISNRDSKDAITMFKGIMEDVYADGIIKSKVVVNNIASELLKQSVTVEKMKNELVSMDAFEQNKKLTIALLSLYESTKIENGKTKISYDQAYTLLNSYSDSFSLDHLLVQKPDENDNEFSYYYDEVDDCLRLKQNSDFPADIYDGMDYETFKYLVLNKIGNLRLYYRDKNSARNNSAIQLREYKNFNKYKNINDRGQEIAKLLLEECMPSPKVNASIQKSKSKKPTN